jgi:RNA polymerase sigma-70 factor (ECF subfamily)
MSAEAARGSGESEERRRLLAAARQGDAGAFRALFSPDLDLAWRMALRIVGTSAGADDALQEGLISAYRSLDRVEPRNLRGWFVRIVQNAARDALRRERRRPTLPLGPLESTDGSDRRGVGVEPVADASSDPQLAAERRELAEELSAALAQIPEERRMAILLYDVDGFDYAEIAELMGCSVGTVKSRISRGREELRRLLGGREAGTRQGLRSLRGRDD